MTNALQADAVVGVVGAGAMGAGIAQLAAQAGHQVLLLDLKPGAAALAIDSIRANFARLVEKGRMKAMLAASAGARLAAAETTCDLRGASIVIEAIAEQLDVKKALFAELEDHVVADCILATNTSSISVTAIAAGLRHPGRVVGMHFFNPAPLMALVEVVSGLATETSIAHTVFDTAIAWGKRPVHTKSTPGFIVNRVARPYYAEALRLLSERAADPATLDAVMREGGGFRMGPFELMDLIGHDVNFAVTRSVFDAFFGDPRFTPSLIQQELVNAGHLGRKSGRGFFDYAKDATAATASTEPAAQLVGALSVWTDGPLGQRLAARLEAGGVTFTRHEGSHADGRVLSVAEAVLFQSDGRSATQRAADLRHAATVLADLTLDAGQATRIALAAADGCSGDDFAAVAAVLQCAGFSVSRVSDVPGLVVLRTVAMLANEAADAVNQGVCDVAAADLAMCKGVNYPKGPLAWADQMGLPALLTVLDHLARVYGEDRYRASPLLRRLVAAGRNFHH